MDDDKRLLIREMDLSLRPREKALARGLEVLTDAELMAIIFATGTKGHSVLDLCHEILDKNGGHLSRVAKMTARELAQTYNGIGTVKAITFLAALQLGKRAELDAQSLLLQQPLRNSTDAYQLMRARLQLLDHEEFWVVYLDRGAHVIREERISMGGRNGTVTDVKLIMRSAVQCLADRLLLYHNHPGGTLRPSAEDDRLTTKIANAAQLFDICVNDHIIISDAGYYSYADHGKL